MNGQQVVKSFRYLLTDPCELRYPAVRSWLVEGRMQFGQLKRREFITLLGGAAIAWPLAAGAQTLKAGYPTKPVRIIVPVAAGGPTDIVARARRQALSEVGPAGVHRE
jgi:hypothetical protein